jgi:hypothetical protein
MAYQILGTGTTHYGEAGWKDKSYVTTLWFTILALPIYPLRSYRVQDMGTSTSNNPLFEQSTTHLRIIEQLPLNRLQVVRWYLFSWSYAILAVLALVAVAKHLVGPGLVTMGIILPFVIYKVILLRNRKKARASQ